MASLIHKVLYPMDLKRYMLLSFATLWTLGLITALVATIVHQIYYQKSNDKILLESEIQRLTFEAKDFEADRLQFKLELAEKNKEINLLISPWNYP